MVIKAFIGVCIVAIVLGIASVVTMAQDIRKENEHEKAKRDAISDYWKRRALRDRRDIDFRIGEDDTE